MEWLGESRSIVKGVGGILKGSGKGRSIVKEILVARGG